MRVHSDDDASARLRAWADTVAVDGRRAVVLLPDHTRTAPVPLMFQTLADAWAGRAASLVFLIALGTHPRLTDDAIDRLVGAPAPERSRRWPTVEVVDHAWDEPSALVSVGTVPAGAVARATDGLLAVDIPVRVNRLAAAADVLVFAGPVFPHEVAGYSGGAKYLIPGVAAGEVINVTHWAGALATSMLTIGERDTPVRQLIDQAAALVSAEMHCVAPVMVDGAVHSLFLGPYPEAWTAATDLSAQHHVLRLDRPVERVLAVAPARYDDLWTGAKAVYKSEPVVADGGEIVVYAPHITEFSVTHGAFVHEVGYHVRDYFWHRLEQFAHIPLAVLAHSTHVRGSGTFDVAAGREHPRIQVTLATGIPRERCRDVGLGWRDPGSIDFDQWAADGALVVPDAGEVLYRCDAVVAAAR